ncbi:MAG: tyrosine-type recombinase/integrase [Coriobacteriia bacterium]
MLDELRHRVGIEGESHIPSRDISFAAFCRDLWMPQRCGVLKDSTRHQYSCMLTSMLKFFGEHGTVRRTMCVSRMQAYVADMSSRGRSATTIHLHLAVLSSISEYAVASGYLDKNPVPSVARPRASAPEPFAFSPGQMRSIIAATPAAHRDLVTVLFGTGLRRSEVAALVRKDWVPATSMVGQGTASLTVARRVWRGRLGEPKTGRRCIAVSPSVASALARAAQGKAEEDLLFPGRTGGFINWDRFTRDVWRPALKRAGTPDASMHASRRTCITITLGAQVAPQVAAKRFGLGVATMMKHYAAVLDESAVAAADAVEEAISPSGPVTKTVQKPAPTATALAAV